MKQKSKKKPRLEIGLIILKVIAAAGIITISLIAPNTLQALKLFDKNKDGLKRRKYYINTALDRLKSKGLIKFEKNNKGITCVRLTAKGKEELAKYELRKLTIKKPKRWDGKYRVVIFDIREQRRKTRDLIRRQLVTLGFVRLQDSVWVYPYECQEIIIMLKANTFIGKDLLYMTVDSIENDLWLKKKFGLH